MPFLRDCHRNVHDFGLGYYDLGLWWIGPGSNVNMPTQSRLYRYFLLDGKSNVSSSIANNEVFANHMKFQKFNLKMKVKVKKAKEMKLVPLDCNRFILLIAIWKSAHMYARTLVHSLKQFRVLFKAKLEIRNGDLQLDQQVRPWHGRTSGQHIFIFNKNITYYMKNVIYIFLIFFYIIVSIHSRRPNTRLYKF